MRALGVGLALLVLAMAGAAPASARTKWLCRPGLANSSCAGGLATTRFSPTGSALGVEHPKRVAHPRIDCFYVYPTVSDQPGLNATRRIDPEIRSIARYQAARYSQQCRVYAPLYRQLTIAALGRPFAAQKPAARLAYRDVLAAWKDYLAHHNHGRGVVLIGHSQGAGHLAHLLRSRIERRPSERRRLVSAILLGGNVTDHSFRHVRACRSSSQTGCVVAWSTFGETPPADTIFGRPSPRFAQVFGGHAGPHDTVLCTNPARLAGAHALDPVYPSQPFAPGTLIAAGIALTGVPQPAAATPWISVPGAYRARCSSAGGAHVLRITPRGGAPLPKPSPDATWGLHLLDANVALGDLVRVVHRQARAYLR
jgi:Protein of unknown function (DUF3089)